MAVEKAQEQHHADDERQKDVLARTAGKQQAHRLHAVIDVAPQPDEPARGNELQNGIVIAGRQEGVARQLAPAVGLTLIEAHAEERMVGKLL